MKLGLIKKSMITVLSLSFIATLAACKKSNIEKTSSSTNIFKNSEILAFAKKQTKAKSENKKVEIVEADLDKYTVNRNYTYTLLRDNTTYKYSLYGKYSNKIIDLNNDDSEYVSNVSVQKDDYDGFGYYEVRYSTGNRAVLAYDGTVIVSKGSNSSITYDRISNIDYDTKGEATFYDIISYNDGENNIKNVYKIDATFEEDRVVKEYTITKLSSSDEIDYSIFNKNGINENMPVKNYNIYGNGTALIVKDLKDNIKSTFTVPQNAEFYFLNGKMFCQTVEQVSINDEYTYTENSKYYLLETYTIDFATGKKEVIKNYDYILDDVEYIAGTKDGRDYIAGVYAELYKITDKRLSNLITTAMVDENGKFLSTKPGEKGYELTYLDENTYVLNDTNTLTLLDKKGNVKYVASKSNNFKIDYENEMLFAPSSTGTGAVYGALLDTDLKIIGFAGSSQITYYYAFDNGYYLININDEPCLVKFENKEGTVVEKYDYRTTSITAYPSYNATVGCRYLEVNDSLAKYNIYLVVTKTTDGWDVEIHSFTGEVLKEIKNVSTLSFNQSYLSCLYVDASSGEWYYGFNTVVEEA